MSEHKREPSQYSKSKNIVITAMYFSWLFSLFMQFQERLKSKLPFQGHPDFKCFSFLDIGRFSTVAFHRLGKVYYQLPKNETRENKIRLEARINLLN